MILSGIEKINYVQKEIKRNWRNKRWWGDRITYHFVGGFYRRLMKNKCTYIVNEDWDNLIVLDACRYDTFNEVTGINADSRISCGSSTPEFLEKNFAGCKLMDTVIVTANPQVDMRVKNSFYKVIPVWDEGWDDKLNTVLPETVVEYALKAEKEYLNKKLIIWFMQPHSPFLDDPHLCPQGYRRLQEQVRDKRPKSPESIAPWKEAAKGKLPINRVWRAYKRNLEIVVPYAFDLAKKLKGRTVITSDHGNAFKRLMFPIPIKVVAHPRGLHIPELVKVPWLVFDDKERKRIIKAGEKEKLKKQVKKLKVKV